MAPRIKIIIMSCLKRHSATAQIVPPFLRCRLCSVSPHNVSSSSGCGWDRMWFCTHTVLALLVAPQMFHWQGAACPERTRLAVRHVRQPRQCVTARKLLSSVEVVFLDVAIGSLPLFLPLRDTSWAADLPRRGWDVEVKLLRDCRRLFTGWWW